MTTLIARFKKDPTTYGGLAALLVGVLLTVAFVLGSHVIGGSGSGDSGYSTSFDQQQDERSANEDCSSEELDYSLAHGYSSAGFDYDGCVADKMGR